MTSISTGQPSSSDDAPRVVHLTVVHHPSDPRIVQKQLRSLAEGGYETHLIAPAERDGLHGDVKMHALPQAQNRWQRVLLHPQAYRQASALDADLYQIHDPELIPVGYLLKKATGATLVYDMHEDYRAKGPLVGRLLRTLEAWCFQWVDHVLVAEASYRSIPGSSTPHTYIANYFRPPEEGRCDEGRPDDGSLRPTELLYTGSISRGRGLETLLDLGMQIRAAGRPGQLRLVGICRHRAQRTWAERRIREQDLCDVIRRTGWDEYVSQDEMTCYYRSADVGLALLEPRGNYVDSLPTKFFEYLYYGVPIICSDFPLWRRFIERHECGAVVPPGTPRAVLDVLDEWQADPERYQELSENARAASRQYLWEEMGDRLVALYQNLLTGSRSN